MDRRELLKAFAGIAVSSFLLKGSGKEAKEVSRAVFRRGDCIAFSTCGQWKGTVKLIKNGDVVRVFTSDYDRNVLLTITERDDIAEYSILSDIEPHRSIHGHFQAYIERNRI